MPPSGPSLPSRKFTPLVVGRVDFSGTQGSFTVHCTYVRALSDDGTFVTFSGFEGTITSPGKGQQSILERRSDAEERRLTLLLQVGQIGTGHQIHHRKEIVMKSGLLTGLAEKEKDL